MKKYNFIQLLFIIQNIIQFMNKQDEQQNYRDQNVPYIRPQSAQKFNSYSSQKLAKKQRETLNNLKYQSSDNSHSRNQVRTKQGNSLKIVKKSRPSDINHSFQSDPIIMELIANKKQKETLQNQDIETTTKTPNSIKQTDYVIQQNIFKKMATTKMQGNKRERNFRYMTQNNSLIDINSLNLSSKIDQNTIKSNKKVGIITGQQVLQPSPQLNVASKLLPKQQKRHRRNQTAWGSMMEQPTPESIQQVCMDLRIKNEDSEEMSPVRFKQRAKSSHGIRNQRASLTQTQMSGMQTTMSQNPFYNNFLARNGFQDMSNQSRERLLEFQKIYKQRHFQEQFDTEEPQVKKKKRQQSANKQMMKSLIRQNRDLGKKYEMFANMVNKFVGLQNGIHEPPKESTDKNIPEELDSNLQSAAAEQMINNSGNLNKSSNIYYNRIQNLTINNARKPFEVYENFISNGPLEPQSCPDLKSPLSYNLPNIQMFSFEGSAQNQNPNMNSVTQTGRANNLGKKRQSENFTNKAEIDDLLPDISRDRMADFLDQNIQSINPSRDSSQLQKLREIQHKKRSGTQMHLEDDVKLQKLMFAMRKELEKKKEVYGDEKLQVLQNAIDQIMGSEKLNGSSQDTFKLLNEPIQRPNTELNDYKQEVQNIKQKLNVKIKHKYQENLKAKLKQEISKRKSQVPQSLQSMFSDDRQMETSLTIQEKGQSTGGQEQENKSEKQSLLSQQRFLEVEGSPNIRIRTQGANSLIQDYQTNKQLQQQHDPSPESKQVSIDDQSQDQQIDLEQEQEQELESALNVPDYYQEDESPMLPDESPMLPDHSPEHGPPSLEQYAEEQESPQQTKSIYPEEDNQDYQVQDQSNTKTDSISQVLHQSDESTIQLFKVMNEDEGFLLQIIDQQYDEIIEFEEKQSFKQYDLQESKHFLNEKDEQFETYCEELSYSFAISGEPIDNLLHSRNEENKSKIFNKVDSSENDQRISIQKLDMKTLLTASDMDLSQIYQPKKDYENSEESERSESSEFTNKISSISQFKMIEIENNVVYRLNSQSDQKRFQNPFKVDQKLRGQKDEQDFNNFAIYVDLVWSRKNNKYAFIVFEDEKYFNEQTQQLQLFDIKTISHENDVFHSIDWEVVEAKIKSMEEKYQDTDNIDRYTPYIDQMILDFNLDNDLNICSNYLIQDNLICIHKSYMKVLMGQFSNIVRVMPIVMKYKIGLINPVTKNHINNNAFHDRYYPLIDLFNFTQKIKKNDEYLKDVEQRQDRLGLKSELSEYTSMVVLGINDCYSLNDLIFSHTYKSLYHMLYDKSQDFVLNQMFDNLYSVQKKIFINSLIKQATHSRVIKIDKNHLNQMLKKKKSYQTWEHQGFTQKLIDEVIQDEEWEEEKKFHTDRDGEYNSYAIREYKRQGALNHCSEINCELQVIRQIEKILIKAKDSVNMNYYRVEGLIDKDDQDYNNFSQLYGYKCNFVRDPEDRRYLMEVFLPILKNQGMKKIRNKYLQSKSGVSALALSRLKQKKLKGKDVTNKFHKKFRDILMVQDMDTDESMEDINYDDVKEDHSDDGDENPEKARHKEKALAKIGNFCTPLEHYNNLRLRRQQSSYNRQVSSSSNLTTGIDQMYKNYHAQYSEDLQQSEFQMNPLKFMKNKSKIESMITQTKSHILEANTEEAKKINQQNEYIDYVRQHAIDHFGSLENYMKYKQGQVLEQNLIEMEKNIKKSVEELEIQNVRLKSLDNKKKKIVRFVSKQEEEIENKILKKLQKEDDEKMFMINNEIDILKGIQQRKKEAREESLKKRQAKDKLLVTVNKIKKGQQMGQQIQKFKKFESMQDKTLRKFRDQLQNEYQSQLNQPPTEMKNTIIKVSINVEDTIKSSIISNSSPRKKRARANCKSHAGKVHDHFKNRMFKAIESSNVGLMKDIIYRYKNQDEYNLILDSKGNTLVGQAALHGDYQMIQLLVENGFDPNIKNYDGNTPLHLAIINEKIKCVDVLIQCGVNEKIKNDKGDTPWELTR